MYSPNHRQFAMVKQSMLCVNVEAGVGEERLAHQDGTSLSSLHSLGDLNLYIVLWI